ncbi:tripartite motif-containing protein 45-like [Stylophora pistillata]|uniref:E3 ubiquitin-protein ligase TRIM71 n=1 Tax=Stylophora pistillata TaxID=50429 RepID=A0A2B4RCA4_STYPI|nr:tripartite motif-containing protein 45-like [Stylophora pistillata]PFX14018.1 E3 ubiquitin-protein ligase TRIM71 [Stylophora pistillata]
MAKASTLAENLEKELECAVCLEQFKDPKVLPCLHSFCKICLEGLVGRKSNAWMLSCPTCRITVEIPEGEVDSLPVNFFLNNLLSMMSLHGDSGSSSLECDLCDNGDPPVNRCTTCSHFLCEFCTQAHQRLRNTRAHGLVSLEEAKRMGSVAVTKPSVCKEHDGQLLKLFCETCDEAICRDCTIVRHREHKYTFVKDAFAKNRENVLKILSETKRKARFLNEAIDRVSEKKRSVDLGSEKTVREVIDCFQNLTASLNSRCEELVDSILKLKQAKQKSLDNQQEQLETALCTMQSSVEFTEKALENGSEVEILNMHKQMTDRLQELITAIWELEPCAHDVFTFSADDRLQQMITNFGSVTDRRTCAGTSTVTMGHGSEGVMYNTLSGQRVEFTVIAKGRNGKKREKGGDTCEVEICTQAGDVVFNDSPKDCGNGMYTFCVTPNSTNMQYQLSVKLNGCHVKGSPGTWFNEMWNLCSDSNNMNLTNGSLKASHQYLSVPLQRTVRGSWGLYENDEEMFKTKVPFKWSNRGPILNNKMAVFGSCTFSNAKHSWKVRLYNISDKFAFGVVKFPSTADRSLGLAARWMWQSNSKYHHSLAPQLSSIMNCISNDVIEFYLDCDTGTSMMHNQRTQESDTWQGVKGGVRPYFEMCQQREAVSLTWLENEDDVREMWKEKKDDFMEFS